MSDTKPVPYVCPECRDTENYYGILVFPGATEAATCPNHKTETGEVRVVLLVPAQ